MSITDDAGNRQSATSVATALTADTLDTPSSHIRQTVFILKLRMSEEPGLSFSHETLRDHVCTMAGGEVTDTQRLDAPGNVRWEITATSEVAGDVTACSPLCRTAPTRGPFPLATAGCCQTRRGWSSRSSVRATSMPATAKRLSQAHWSMWGTLYGRTIGTRTSPGTHRIPLPGTPPPSRGTCRLRGTA